MKKKDAIMSRPGKRNKNKLKTICEEGFEEWDLPQTDYVSLVERWVEGGR